MQRNLEKLKKMRVAVRKMLEEESRWADTAEFEQVISNYVLALAMLEVDSSVQMLGSE